MGALADNLKIKLLCKATDGDLVQNYKIKLGLITICFYFLFQEFRAVFLDYYLTCSREPNKVYNINVPGPSPTCGTAINYLSRLALMIIVLNSVCRIIPLR